MTIYDYKDYELFCIGDIHGEFKRLFNVIKMYSPKQMNGKKVRNEEKGRKIVFIVCGDCGLGFNKHAYYDELFSKFNRELEALDFVLLFVRGNHDDKSYYDGEKINYSRIKAIPDYSVVITSSLTTLCIGGAISFDRTWRIQQEAIINRYKPKDSKKKIFWEDERIVYDEDKLNEIMHNGLKIDSVITHALPSEFTYQSLEKGNKWFLVDPKLKDDFESEKTEITKIIQFLLSNNCDITIWVNGHIHRDVAKVVDLKEGMKTYWKSLSDNINGFNMSRAKNEIMSIRRESLKKDDEKTDKESFNPFFTYMKFADIGPTQHIVDGLEAIGDEDNYDDTEENPNQTVDDLMLDALF